MIFQDATQIAKCYSCGKYKPKESFWFLHSPDYQWQLCSLKCVEEHVKELVTLTKNNDIPR